METAREAWRTDRAKRFARQRLRISGATKRAADRRPPCQKRHRAFRSGHRGVGQRSGARGQK